MPKYYEFKVAGYYLYFTSFCTIECMHVHASDRKLTEAGSAKFFVKENVLLIRSSLGHVSRSAKFFVKENGDTVLQNNGILNNREILKIQDFIKDNYKDMYLKWAKYSENGFYGEK